MQRFFSEKRLLGYSGQALGYAVRLQEMIAQIHAAKFGSGAPVAKPVVPVVKPEAAQPVKGETRQQKWKRLHPEKVRLAQKLLMQRRRAKEK